MDGTAILLTGGLLATSDGKTAHGLIRGTARYRILAVVDAVHAGHDAGEILDGKHRALPIHGNLCGAIESLGARPQWCIVGVATSGGRLPQALRAQVGEALDLGISVVCGLHELLGDDPELAARAKRTGARLLDLRRTKPFAERHFWTGESLRLGVARVAVLGTDCAIGKRTTARLLVEACQQEGLRAEMIFTGQTGWMQGIPYGFLLDATVNDFVAGELEHEVVRCAREADPDVIFINGQSALRNPSGPCGAELLVSVGTRGVILHHAPHRECYEGMEHLHKRIPSLRDEIALIAHYGARVLGVTLNGEGLSHDEFVRARDALAADLGLPVARPLEDGVAPLLPAVRAFISEERARQR